MLSAVIACTMAVPVRHRMLRVDRTIYQQPVHIRRVQSISLVVEYGDDYAVCSSVFGDLVCLVCRVFLTVNVRYFCTILL